MEEGIENNQTGMVRLKSAGEVIRSLRQERGLSIRALASQLHWDKSRISKYENNAIAMSTDVIEKLAGAFGLPPLALLLRCIRHVHPELKDADNEAGLLLTRMEAAVISDQRRRRRSGRSKKA